jgi:hypothetical protein
VNLPTFMMLYVGLAAQPSAGDEGTQDYNQQWSDYMRELATAGALESGSPFAPGGMTVRRNSVVSTELANIDVGGYALVRAESLDAAVEIAKRAPHIALGGTTIVRPCITLRP